MKLPTLTFQEISNLAERAEAAIYVSNSRTADRHIIENAIRNALQIINDRMNIQVPNTFTIDLSKN